MTKQIAERKVTRVPFPEGGVPLADLAVGNLLERLGVERRNIIRELIIGVAPLEETMPGYVYFDSLRRGKERFSWAMRKNVNTIEKVRYRYQPQNGMVTELEVVGISISEEGVATYCQREDRLLRGAGIQ